MSIKCFINDWESRGFYHHWGDPQYLSRVNCDQCWVSQSCIMKFNTKMKTCMVMPTSLVLFSEKKRDVKGWGSAGRVLGQQIVHQNSVRFSIVTMSFSLAFSLSFFSHSFILILFPASPVIVSIYDLLLFPFLSV